ncbi:iron-containing redox enzyme family protein [Amycolatopsis keratiniphila]|uniref:Uncharacterized protein n=1 Tax=Amycolatopsis keratiniphila TaxID=129921 RepID=R4SLQ2_9PSEU|nr:iron-containing redox enzyme family protein [Amycolatopsis keratiniphila]AGM04479.1 hypothetical protein AORI_1891 [Amycolatopsis keratiniphila]
MVTKPYLKPAAVIDRESENLRFTYRGRAYTFPVSLTKPVELATMAMDGRTPLPEIALNSLLATDEVQDLVTKLSGTPLLLDGEQEVLADGGLSGREAYWRLEGQMWDWRGLGQRTDIRPVTPLDVEVGAGRAPIDVVKGFCLEICHQVSNAPREISLAIANAPTKAARDLYMEFYEEEHPHGDMLREALAHWLPETGIDAAVPLPQTLGLLNTYNWWAQSDPLLYAVALMRDEGSGLDATPAPETDVYEAMRTHYDVPKEVTERFHWHATLDADLDHGSFPLDVFSTVPVIEPLRYAALTKAARGIVELYDALMNGVLEYYSANSAESRWSQVTTQAMAR